MRSALIGSSRRGLCRRAPPLRRRTAPCNGAAEHRYGMRWFAALRHYCSALERTGEVVLSGRFADLGRDAIEPHLEPVPRAAGRWCGRRAWRPARVPRAMPCRTSIRPSAVAAVRVRSASRARLDHGLRVRVLTPDEGSHVRRRSAHHLAALDGVWIQEEAASVARELAQERGTRAWQVSRRRLVIRVTIASKR